MSTRPAYTITVTDLGAGVGWSVARDGEPVKTGAVTVLERPPLIAMVQAFHAAWEAAEDVRRRRLADDLEGHP